MKNACIRVISGLVPYVSVLVGLNVFESAWVAIGLYHFGMILFLVVCGDRKSLIVRVRAGWDPIIAVIAVAMSVTIFPIIYFLWGYMQLENVRLGSALANFGLEGNSWVLFMIYFSTVQPFLEEVYWRGYLKSGRKYFSWTDIAFAGYHILVLAWFIKIGWLVTAFVLLAGAGFVWRYLASRLEGLIVPVLSHIAADISVIVVTYVLIR